MKTITKSARLSMKTKTNTLLGAVLFLLVICAAAPRAHAQEGTLVSWGENTYGEVSGTPAGIFTAVAAGSYHNLAIRSDGTLASWGNDGYGVVSGTPAGIFTAIAAGYFHSLAVRTDGTLASWGYNEFGQVSGTPSGTFNAFAAGFLHSVAIRSDGTLVSWGNDGYGVVSGTPAGTFVTVAANDNRSVAIRANGTLAAWGGPDHYGQVSDIPAGTFVAVACGYSHNVAIRSDGTLTSWGYGLDGQVSDTPAGTFTAVAAGDYYSVAIRTDGTLVAWGYDSGQVVSGIPAGTFSTIGANINHATAIRLPLNEAPLATDDFYGMNQASSLSVPSPGVLANDSDPDEDPLTVELVTGPANATSFQLNPDGSFSYTPPPSFYGEDTFTYKAYDGTAYSEIASVHITVAPTPSYSAQVQPPINADATSVFNVKRGVIPVKFTLSQDGTPTCALPPAIIVVTRTAGGATGTVNESVYIMSADTGSNFRIDGCQYIYNLSSSALGTGTYRVDITINSQLVGSATFKLK